MFDTLSRLKGAGAVNILALVISLFGLFRQITAGAYAPATEILATFNRRVGQDLTLLHFLRARFQSPQQTSVNSSRLFSVRYPRNIVFLLRQNPQPGLEPRPLQL